MADSMVKEEKDEVIKGIKNNKKSCNLIFKLQLFVVAFYPTKKSKTFPIFFISIL